MYVLITKSVDLHGCKQKKKKSQLNVPGYLNLRKLTWLYFLWSYSFWQCIS